MLRPGSLLVLSVLAGVGVAAAVEQPISASRLTLRRSSSGKERLTFVSKDPAFLFPTIGGPDDPTPSGSGGLVVELFSPGTPAGVALDAPGGLGNPGWAVRTSVPPRLQFKNGGAPGALSTFRSITLRQSKQLKLNGKETGLDLSAPLGAVGIRITTGSLVNCARFFAGTVTKDANGTFVGRNAPANALPDCSNASLASPYTVTTTTDVITSSTIPTTTTTTLAGTCGDGVVNQPSEDCDGTVAGAFCDGIPGLDGCGPPEYPTACQCCVLHSVPALGRESPCCDPLAVEVNTPSEKVCVSTRCNEAFDCSIGTCQPDGSCCAAVGTQCGFAFSGGGGVGIGCCNPAAICQPVITPPFVLATCCLPGGNGCSANSECCSGTCASGTCAP